MTDYAIWKPEHDGHAPPNWREGMGCWHFDRRIPSLELTVSKPQWFAVDTYAVPAEALNSPNDDASGELLNEDMVPLKATAATLRDYFAAAALQGLLARMSERDYASSVDAEDWSFATGDAFRIADDMLRSRKDERDA